ncbi:MAG: 6-phosphogluconate dehydrogenase, partial [Planctomycetota bacterium]
MKSETMAQRASFGMIGLGVMGRNLALNVEERGFPVAVWNLEPELQQDFLAQNPGKQLVGAKDLAALVESLERPRRIMMMVTAGRAVDSVLDSLIPLLDKGDIVIDGGNTWYEDTQRREARLRDLGLRFVGMGVSGGEEGARNGPSLMPGGDPAAYEELRGILESIAAKTDSGPCVTHIGTDGAGHFSKMVHNGIEYADMQLLAEAYDLMKRTLGFDSAQIADTFGAWNKGPLESFLVEITSQIFQVQDEVTGKALVESVLDRAGQKGTGKWTCQAALELGIPVPAIAAALDARVLSSFKPERQDVFEAYDEGDRAPSVSNPDVLQELEDALLAAKVCAYAQGLDLLRAAGNEYGWSMDLRELARIWKGGCII